MRRMASAFYKDIYDLRSAFGDTEYNRDQILPAVIGLLRKHEVRDSDLIRDVANGILDNLEKAEDKASELERKLGQTNWFSYDAQVALGGRNRIKRGRLNMEQLLRRKRVIDHNKRNQDRAWGAESDWLDTAMDALKGHDLATTVQDVMPPAPQSKAGAAT